MDREFCYLSTGYVVKFHDWLPHEANQNGIPLKRLPLCSNTTANMQNGRQVWRIVPPVGPGSGLEMREDCGGRNCSATRTRKGEDRLEY